MTEGGNLTAGRSAWFYIGIIAGSLAAACLLVTLMVWGTMRSIGGDSRSVEETEYRATVGQSTNDRVITACARAEREKQPRTQLSCKHRYDCFS